MTLFSTFFPLRAYSLAELVIAIKLRLMLYMVLAPLGLVM